MSRERLAVSRSGAAVRFAMVSLFALSACGTAHPGTGGASSAGSSPSPSATETAQQRAEADAAAIVKAFVPPPGARKLAKAPVLDGGALRNPGFWPMAEHYVDKTSWWLVPGTPQGVANYEHAHLPHQFTLGMTGPNGSITGTAGVTAVTSFELAGVPGVLIGRELLLTMVPADTGGTDVRVDAFVGWQPPRPASERVPASARIVTITLVPGLNDHSTPPGPVTITDPAKVRRLVSDLDGLDLAASGLMCANDVDRGVQLTFRARPGGSVLAVAFADAMGCDTVNFTIGSKRQPQLSGGAELGQQALAVAGLTWRMYG